jgi:hypothetical protein
MQMSLAPTVGQQTLLVSRSRGIFFKAFFCTKNASAVI